MKNIHLAHYITPVIDYPKPGIKFYDITTLLADTAAFEFAIEQLSEYIAQFNVDKIVGLEARGFIFASAIASRLKKPLVLIRKTGKLPRKTISEEYQLEYGKNSLEIHADSIVASDRVAIIDDVLATGGTMRAACNLVEKLDGQVTTIVALAALPHLCFAAQLENYNLHYLVEYEA